MNHSVKLPNGATITAAEINVNSGKIKMEIHCAHDLPISQCQEHWIEFCELTDNTIEQRAVAWLLGDDTGTSSKTICAHMLGVPIAWKSPPADASDRGRCIRLLKLIPEWIARLDELEAQEPGRPETVNGNRIHDDDWAHQLPLIKQEGNL